MNLKFRTALQLANQVREGSANLARRVEACEQALVLIDHEGRVVSVTVERAEAQEVRTRFTYGFYSDVFKDSLDLLGGVYREIVVPLVTPAVCHD